MPFDVLITGVGDAFSERHVSTSFVLVADGYRLAIDCPDRYRAVLRRAAARAKISLPFSELNDFLITHLHGDHVNGLEAVGFFKHFVEQRQVKLYAPPEVRADIWDRRLAVSMDKLWDGTSYRTMRFEDYFDFQELTWGAPTSIGPFTIASRRTIHHLPTAALMIEADGRRLGYSCDTAFDPQLIAFLEPADLIIHETNYGPAHTDAAALAGLPEALRAKMRLVHYPDEFAPDACGIALLHEGELLRL